MYIRVRNRTKEAGVILYLWYITIIVGRSGFRVLILKIRQFRLDSQRTCAESWGKNFLQFCGVWHTHALLLTIPSNILFLFLFLFSFILFYFYSFRILYFPLFFSLLYTFPT
jgi:hypothetical protein